MKDAPATPDRPPAAPAVRVGGARRSDRSTQLAALLSEVETLIADVDREGSAQARSWADGIVRADFSHGALNLAHYMALRRRDLRSLQRRLMVLGLSSLGRSEGKVMPTLLAVRAALRALLALTPGAAPSARTFFAGERRLARHTHELLGAPGKPGTAALLVTCPTEAATDPGFMLALAARGVQAVRINCAHDGPEAWRLMIDHLRAAEAATGRSMKIFMDLAGPKIRTGAISAPKHDDRVKKGEPIAIANPGALDAVANAGVRFAAECTLAEAVAGANIGDRVFIDDGKLGAVVERLEPWGVLARVTMVADRGLRLKPEKGLNFPDRHLAIEALTRKDLADLAFIATHADGVGFSFVQSAADVAMLQAALAALRPDDWRSMALILKIETAMAVSNLPEIIVQAAGRQPTAIMIARGDLAVEIGFARTAEMQEEILWLGEAAEIPVIWATQVLEHLVTKGTPSRGEMTDAAMAARSECVMLNKGPYLFEAIDQLVTLFWRMEANQHKKAPQLRRLRSW